MTAFEYSSVTTDSLDLSFINPDDFGSLITNHRPALTNSWNDKEVKEFSVSFVFVFL